MFWKHKQTRSTVLTEVVMNREVNFFYSGILRGLLQFCLRCHVVQEQIQSRRENSRRSICIMWFMCKMPLCFWCCQLLLLHRELRSGNRCCSDLLGVGVATAPQTLKTIPPQCTALLMLDDKSILTESWLHFKILFLSSYNFLFFPTAVHETSKRLSQTLRDVYEPDWNGGEDLAVITEACSWCVVVNACLNICFQTGGVSILSTGNICTVR